VTPAGGLRFVHLVWAWAASLAGFLVGEYGAGILLNLRMQSDGPEAALALAWLPWLAAPVLSGVLGAWALPVARVTRWWQWLVATLVVPLGAAAVTTAVVVSAGASTAGLPRSVLVQLVVSGGLGVAVGSWRSARFAQRPPAPVTYTTPDPEDQLA
jgi:hypothetical protein